MLEASGSSVPDCYLIVAANRPEADKKAAGKKAAATRAKNMKEETTKKESGQEQVVSPLKTYADFITLFCDDFTASSLHQV